MHFRMPSQIVEFQFHVTTSQNGESFGTSTFMLLATFVGRYHAPEGEFGQIIYLLTTTS